MSNTEATPDRILDTAERLFADHGIGAVSLRRIIGEAGVNVAAVHYHFGSKEELIRAVFRRRIGEVNRQRIKLLAELKESHPDRPIPVREVLRAFLLPPLQLGHDEQSGGRDFFRLAGRAHSEPDPIVRDVLFSELRETVALFLVELKKSTPAIEDYERAMRLVFVAGAMVQAIMQTHQQFFQEHFSAEDLKSEASLDLLLEFCVAGFEAPAAPSAPVAPSAPTASATRKTGGAE